MTNASLALIDILFWPVTQLAISLAMVRLPASLFEQQATRAATPQHSFALRVYRASMVRRWKKWLPDGAFLVGGQNKRVNPFQAQDCLRFLAETRRAEIAHWIQLACAAFCWLWNPLWAALVMTAYALLANLPCILAQRYNRLLLLRRMAARRRSQPISIS